MGEDEYLKILERIYRGQSPNHYAVDALSYYQGTQHQTPAKRKVDPLEAAADCDLIMELMKRGYAVWLPPAEGK